MSKEVAIIALGVWVIIIPYLGVPMSWRTVLLVLTGIAVMVLGFLLRSETLAGRPGSRLRAGAPFVEHVPDRAPDASAASHEVRHDHQEGINSLN